MKYIAQIVAIIIIYLKIVMNAMSGSTIEEQQENIDKIVKNVTKAVTIDKYAVRS